MKGANLLKHPFRSYLIFTTTFLLFFLFVLVSKVSAGNILFEDNFDNGNIDDWQIVSGNWIVQNQKFGTRIETQYTLAETQIGDYSWTNYEFEVDLAVISGEDRNLFFRSNPERSIYGDRLWNWPCGYGLHITSGKTYLVKFLPASSLYVDSANFSFPTGTTHKIKMSALDERIRIYIDNNLLIDFIDSSPGAFLSGRIALAASTGSVSPTEVWYDNVVVTDLSLISTPTPTQTPSPTPTPTPPTPVVFLPGLGGSINFKEMFLGQSDPTNWKMTPGANVYDNLLKAFEGNSNFYVFYYDWRKPVLETAQKLNNYIHTTVHPWNNKVYLVGHSLGGLVARTCVQKTGNNCYADKLITVGSPNFGAVDAYPALEGGEVWRTGPIKLGYELLLHYFQLPGETRKETIQRIAPVLKDLLPNFNYLTKNGINLPPSDLSIKNSLLLELQNLSSLENKTKTITGRGFNSIEQIILTEPNWIDKLLGNWPDGKPTDKQFTLEGDTSVLVKSSSFTNPLIENFTYDRDHGGIISEQEPLTKIMELLGLELKPGIYDALNDEENFLVIFVHSPVKISSPDITPDSYATDELIIIPSPSNKNYTLNVEGIGSGFYSLSIGQIGTESASWQDYYGEAQIGKTQNFEFDINSENPPEDPLVNNQDFYSSEFDTLLNQCKNLTNSQIAIQKYKNIILSLLNLISKEKNNPEMALNYVNLLRNTIATLEKQGNLDSALANQLRKYSSKLTSYLEEKTFDNPKITAKTQAGDYFNSAKTMLDQMEAQHNFSKTATLIFLEAKEKLSEAQNYLNLNQYYQTKILAKNIIGLLLEVKILSR